MNSDCLASREQVSVASPEVCLVSPEALWPATHGGRVRTAMIAEEISRHRSLVVVTPDRPDAPQSGPPAGVDEVRVRWSSNGNQLRRLSRSPLLGRNFCEPLLPTLVNLMSGGTSTFVWSHSYMAEVGIPHLVGARHIVDFANIEGARFASIASNRSFLRALPLRVEALKARLWEPSVARAATASLAVSERDLAVIRAWGGVAHLAKNGMTDRIAGPSGESQMVLAVGNWSYEPNAIAIQGFLANHWPNLLRRRPETELVIVGRGSELLAPRQGVRSLGFVDDLGEIYHRAALCLALASGGAGSQLKVVEALSHGRVVVGPPFLAGELQLGAPEGTIVPSPDLVSTISRLLDAPDDRRLLEESLREYVAAHTWSRELNCLTKLIEK